MRRALPRGLALSASIALGAALAALLAHALPGARPPQAEATNPGAPQPPPQSNAPAAGDPGAARAPWPGFLAPEIAGRALGGGFLSPAELIGRRPGELQPEESGSYLLLNFWATWCGPCRAELPLLARVHEAWADPEGAVPLRVATVNVKEDAQAVAAFFGGEAPPFPVLLDDGAAAGAYAVWGIPVTFLIDPAGRILRRIQGPLTAHQLCRILEEEGVPAPRCAETLAGEGDAGAPAS